MKIGYSADDLCESISGYGQSTFHTGQNQHHRVYDDLCLMLRDAAHIDQGITFTRQAGVLSMSDVERKNFETLKNWKPPEIRNAGK